MIATEKILAWLMFSTISILFFGSFPGISLAAQLSALVVLVFAAALALVMGQVRRVPLGTNEWVFLALVLISFVSSMLNDLPYSMQYTVLFAAAICAVIVLSRALSFQTIFESTAASFAVMVCVSIVLDPVNYLVGLSAQHIKGLGLLRYTQLGLHPNLAGFIFGGGTILLWVRALQKKGLARLAFLVLSALSFSLVMAASSRSGMLATVAAFTLVGLTRLFPLSRRNARLLGLALAGGGLAVVLTDLGTKAVGYLIKITDFESSTRGLGSGASGRTDLWLQGLAVIGNRDFLPAMFGSGLRSTDTDAVGFLTENAYITVLIENGLLAGGLALVVLVLSLGLYLLRSRRGDLHDLLIAMLLCFVLIESTLNRYIFGIGNPLSLYYLFIYAALLRHRPAFSPGALSRQRRAQASAATS
ncbi:hypothetical protein [Phaeovulum vinaykumarii]|uniref:O-antigen ligase n=1 Tax=Phaeovulum vinaykumarii TaxID=407234 RepID=A0A1N7N326_9RHOB|nr:hypothetical protein [Phaeovulum vinaykumarii]SIS92742.1 hypothetical protein SAMN05421795_11510 [Phaeovulum vinaykumarii]SOC19091.1 hypothetical protein SAMN05878426_1166 [Phaeovulum vinaykumarii]